MSARRDEAGAAFAGSQLQTQIYVNRRASQVDDAIEAAFPELAGATFEWRSPLAADDYREYWDKRFLECLDLIRLADALQDFWPSGGPHWDAMALVRLPGDNRAGVLLGEGKSYPGELFGSGTGAKPGSSSRQRIEDSLRWTQELLGVSERSPDDWCGRLYQSANRLAHVHWLREQGVRAWLVHLLFTDDPRGATSAEDWERAMVEADKELGVAGLSIPAAAHVILPAGTRDELLTE